MFGRHCIPPSEVEGGDAMREEIVPRNGGDEDVPTHFPIEERAGDANDGTK